MPHNNIPEPWKSFLKEIDSALSRRTELHCLGGFVVTILYGLKRPTADVDVLSITPTNQRNLLLQLAGKGSALQEKYKLYLDYVTVATAPEDYEERLTEMFPGAFRHLRLYALDPYDIALAKLERNTQRDRDDIKYLAKAVPLDLAILKERYQRELRPNLGNPKREDLTLKLWIEAIEEDRPSE
jgi:hypothetical protein